MAEPIPAWLDALARLPDRATSDQLSRFAPPAGHRRQSAVLMLFTGSPSAVVGRDAHLPEDVLLTERAHTLRSHAGQVAFPGGRVDPEDDGPAGAAVREAVEETGLDADGVEVIGCLPQVYLPVSDYAVTPVLAWWRTPSPVRVVDAGEVSRVARVPVGDLVDPGNRFMVRHPSGFVGPAFAVSGLLVWGFTAGLLDRLLHLAGWEQEWDRDQVRDVVA